MDEIKQKGDPHAGSVLFVLVTVLLDMLSMGVVIPVLPTLIMEFEGGSSARSAEIYGLFGTMWALMQFFAAPILGALSDRIGRRPVILLSNLGLGLDYLLMALAPNLTWLFIGRMLSGIVSASVPAATAYISDVAAPEKRTQSFGLIGAAVGIGYVLGPAAGGILGSYDPRYPFWLAAIISLINFLYGLLILPESLPVTRRTAFRWHRANPVGAFALFWSSRHLARMAAVLFLGYLAYQVLPSVFVLYAEYRYAWDERSVGLTLASIGVSGILVSAFLVRPAILHAGERWTLVGGLLFGAIGFIQYGIAPSGSAFLLGVPIMSLWGVCGPAALGIMTKHVANTEYGRLQGAISALSGVTGLIGPGLFTFTFAFSIHSGHSIQLPGAPFFLAGTLCIAAAFFAWKVAAPIVSIEVETSNTEINALSVTQL